MPRKYIDVYDQIISNSVWNGRCLESTFKVCDDNKSRRPYFTREKKLISVSREWWTMHNGDIPLGLYVCHHCDNPKCFRIDHLFLGTPADNIYDMNNKKRCNNFGRKKYSKIQLDLCIHLRKGGITYREIGERLNMKPSAVSAHCMRFFKEIS